MLLLPVALGVAAFGLVVFVIGWMAFVAQLVR